LIQRILSALPRRTATASEQQQQLFIMLELPRTEVSMAVKGGLESNLANVAILAYNPVFVGVARVPPLPRDLGILPLILQEGWIGWFEPIKRG
jgi:hypothetical protein